MQLPNCSKLQRVLAEERSALHNDFHVFAETEARAAAAAVVAF
jgi:hypothetical protein